MTPKDHEEYVRSRWDEGFFKHDLKLTNEYWSAAYAFTIEREEQIRCIEREIEWLESFGPQYCREDLDRFGELDSIPEDDGFWDRLTEYTRDYATRERILARMQATLAELKKGLRQ